MSIEGIPDGWELVAFRRATPGEFFLDNRGLPEKWSLTASSNGIFAIIRKIEKPKRYRPFANAAEFEPHRDRWVRYRGDDYGGSRVAFYDNTHARIDDDVDNWNGHFKDYTFDDGTPFGIEVTE